MAGAGLIAIKRRIKSVTNTRKITKAMGLVATAKLRKSRERLTVNQRYYNQYVEIIKELLSHYEENSIFIKGNGSNKKLYVVFTSDTGLCGGFNMNIVGKVVELSSKDKENSSIMVIGQKGKNYFKRLRYETAAEYVEVPDLPGVKEAREISNRILRLFINGEFGEVYVVFTKFVSAVKQEVTINKLLPVSYSADSSSKDDVIFEPDLNVMIDDVISLYIDAFISNCMLNSKGSEHSARMSAMDGATKNANDLLERLNLKFNRIRQSAITQEISEIVGGAEVQR